MAYRNFTNPELLQLYLNQQFNQPDLSEVIDTNSTEVIDTGMPVYNTFDLTKGGITDIPINIGRPTTMFQDFYSPVYEPYDPEKDDEQVSYNELTGMPSFKDRVGKFTRNVIGQPGISSLIGFINPVAGLVSRGLGYLGRNLSPSFVGPKGARGYGSESIGGLFARSNTLADFFQNVRDKRARDAAAARGAAKQAAIAASQQVDTGGGSGSSFDAPSGGTFGSSVNDAGSFSDYS